MTKAEGIQRLKAGEKVMRRSMIAGLTALGLSVLTGAAIGSHNAQEIFVGVGVALMMVCMVVGGIANTRVKCAKCGRLLQAVPAQIAVATGHCGYCWEMAFDDAPEEKIVLAAAQVGGNLKGNL